MGKKQVMLIGLDPTKHDVEYLFDNDEILFHLAEDIADAADTVHITPVEMLIVNEGVIEGDHVEYVTQLHEAIEAPHLPVVLLSPERIGEAEVYYRTGDQTDLEKKVPGINMLPAVVDLTLAHSRLASMEKNEVFSLADQLARIGFNDTIQTGEKAIIVQTEVAAYTEPVELRSRVYFGGAILVDHRVELDPASLGLEALKKKAADVHRSTVEEASGNLDESSRSTV